MSEQTRPFELVEFEQVDATPGTALLRIAARPSAAAQAGPWTLVLTCGRQVHRHPQLPALPGPPGVTRAAFSAPAQQCAPGTVFALRFSDDSTVQLPSPSPRRSVLSAPRHAPELETPGKSQSQDARRLEAERRAELLADARAHASRRELTAVEEQLAQAEERAAESDEQIKSLRELAQRTGTQHSVELQTSESRLDVTHAELEVARAELRALKSQNERLESTIAEVDRALAVRGAEIDLLQGAVVEAHAVERQASESVRRLADEQVARRLADARSEASTTLIAEIEVLRLHLRELQEQAHTLKQSSEESDRRALAAEGELHRVRDAAALVAAELMNASDAANQARGEAVAYRRRAEQLQQALLEAAAGRALEKDFLAIEKQAREEALFSRLAEVQANADAAVDAAREQH